MTDVVWIGRGGQGAFTAARLLGAAYSLRDGGGYALAFPSFGPERRGAPMKAFTKLSAGPISDRSEARSGDFSVYLDDTLLRTPASGAGKVLVNTSSTSDDPRVVSLDADGIAAEVLGSPIVNTVMLGALAALLGGFAAEDLDVGIENVLAERLWDKNKKAARKAYDAVAETLR
ncbi:MAG: 2-oxoacid:acceptor oxidoreductase family protein [Candidatus Methanoplasma sp.]|jgi:pyruvate ferredoxin oxidoreductase gamma subunit|nr:2-oxoacid:acceptor oxidoreductase family protein [Candidatus Methanoplasma sp.]